MNAKEKLEKLFDTLYESAVPQESAIRVTEEEAADEDDTVEMEKVVDALSKMKEQYNRDITKLVEIQTKLVERIEALESDEDEEVPAEPMEEMSDEEVKEEAAHPDSQEDEQETPDSKDADPNSQADKQTPKPAANAHPDSQADKQQESTDNTEPEVVSEESDSEEAEESEPQAPVAEKVSLKEMLERKAERKKSGLVEVFKKMKEY